MSQIHHFRIKYMDNGYKYSYIRAFNMFQSLSIFMFTHNQFVISCKLISKKDFNKGVKKLCQVTLQNQLES